MSFDAWVGRTETRSDAVWPLLVRGMAATLDLPTPRGPLPPLWHWMLFADWVPASGLGPDGHPKRGGFLPPVHDLPRRMWAGGRLQFHAPLHEGDPVTRSSTILSITEKSGGSGRLVFVTLRHDIDGPDGLAITEEQDIVYRGAEAEAVKPGEPADPVNALAAREVRPDAVLLFRYSALTGNGHRIHYDADYVRNVEGLPGSDRARPAASHLAGGAGGRAGSVPPLQLPRAPPRLRRACIAGRSVAEQRRPPPAHARRERGRVHDCRSRSMILAFLTEPVPPRGVLLPVLPGVSRIVADNPGRMTYHGTNTYLIEDADGVTVLDPGPDDAAHVADIQRLSPGPIVRILLSHTHRDHFGGVAALKAATGAPTLGWHRSADEAFVPDIGIQDGEMVLGDGGAVHAGPRGRSPVLCPPRWGGVHRGPRDGLVIQYRQPARRRHGGLFRQPAPDARPQAGTRCISPATARRWPTRIPTSPPCWTTASRGRRPLPRRCRRGRTPPSAWCTRCIRRSTRSCVWRPSATCSRIC